MPILPANKNEAFERNDEILESSSFKISPFRRVNRGGRGGGLPCPFLKFKEKCPDFGKKCPS